MPHCIFCQQPFGPKRRPSAEHAAPKWCRDLVPDLEATHHMLIVETAAGTVQESRGIRNPFTTVIKGLCVPCNTGWMHELEETSKDILGYPIQGRKRNLQFFRQVLAATWAMKTGMVWDYISPDNRAVSLDQLRMLHQTQRPNPRHQIWIGQFLGDAPHSFRRTTGNLIKTAGPLDSQHTHGYLIAFSIGQLAFVIYGHGLPVPANVILPQQFNPKLIQTWPPIHEIVNWPPTNSLNDAELDTIMHSLGEPINPQPTET